MAFLAMLRTFLFLYVTIHAEAMHRFIAVVALVAGSALLYPVRISLFMMALHAFHPHILMDLMGKPDRTDGALHRRNPVCSLAGGSCLRNGYHIGIFFSSNPGIKAAGACHESGHCGNRRDENMITLQDFLQIINFLTIENGYTIDQLYPLCFFNIYVNNNVTSCNILLIFASEKRW